MKKLLLTIFTIICFVNVQAQCNSNPYINSGSGGTVYFADSSTITPGWSTNYSVSYLWDFRMDLLLLSKVHVTLTEIYRLLFQELMLH